MYVFICSWVDTAYTIACKTNGSAKVDVSMLFPGLMMGFLTGSCIFNFLMTKNIAAKKLACFVMIGGAVALAAPAWVMARLKDSDRYKDVGSQIFVPEGKDADLNQELRILNLVGFF